MSVDELVPLRTLPKTIAAVQYNRVRLALMRLGKPLELDISRLHIEMILDDRHWLCVRPMQNRVPLLAWTGFEARRSALHEPVRCELQLYHYHAGLLMGVTLDVLDEVLGERLIAHRLEI